MRRLSVCERDRPDRVKFPVGLALAYHRQPAGDQLKLALLPGDDFGKLVNDAGQMRDFFFKACGVGHKGAIACNHALAETRRVETRMNSKPIHPESVALMRPPG